MVAAEHTETKGNYENLLSEIDVPFKVKGDFLLHGEITSDFGWIIHISTIIIQVPQMLETVCPYLHDNEIAFRIPKNEYTATMILDGGRGCEVLGKIVSIYPSSDSLAIKIVDKLITITKCFSGPAILTDAKISNCLFVRYGGHKIIQSMMPGNSDTGRFYKIGEVEIEDKIKMPFQLPTGKKWPFNLPIVEDQMPNELIRKVRQLKPIKIDPKGSVYKGYYLKWGVFPFPCVVKQGNAFMLSDSVGQDMIDRMKWQHRLQTEFSRKLKLPEVYAFIESDNHVYLVMEEIQGKPLYQAAMEINKGMVTFSGLNAFSRNKLLKLCISLCEKVEETHNLQLICRDITPGNFMLDTKGRIIPIDNELAFYIPENYPSYPFGAGTPGFMSPEQRKYEKPTFAEDYYGLASTIVTLVTRISPNTIRELTPEITEKVIFQLTEEKAIAEIFMKGRDKTPSNRLTARSIKEKLLRISLTHKESRVYSEDPLTSQELDDLISAGIRGLSRQPMVMFDGIWATSNPVTDFKIKPLQGFHLDPTFHSGVAGVCYVLGKAAQLGFDVKSEKPIYQTNLVFCVNNANSIGFNPGLHYGKSGIAAAIIAGIKGNLIFNNDSNQALIKSLLNISSKDLSLGDGLSGQGAALLTFKDLTEDTFIDSKLSNIIDYIISNQNKNGIWFQGENRLKAMGDGAWSMINGNPGVASFLVKAMETIKEEKINMSLNKFIPAAVKLNNEIRKRLRKEGISHFFSHGSLLAENVIAITRLFQNLYSVLGYKYLKNEYEETLGLFEPMIISENFSQDAGLCGIGEALLEAFKLSKQVHWRNQAVWIKNLIASLAIRRKEFPYWVTLNKDHPTIGIIPGNAGIIHFLLKYKNVDEISNTHLCM